MLRGVWNHDLNIWEETATQEEVIEHKLKEAVTFYNSELKFASNATTELLCELITVETFEEVKTYMKAIDPFAIATTLEVPNRPSIFDRYQ
ncbi:MAG: hypothetical protein ACRCZ2_01135 [Fusobacteriaceae bacterium]